MKYVCCLVVLIAATSAFGGTKFTKRQLHVIKTIRSAAKFAEVPSDILLAICYQESLLGELKNLTKMDGKTLSHGVCQIKLETAEHMDKVYKHKIKATAERLEDISINAFYAAKYLRYQLRNYKWNLKLAVDAYNKGTAYGEETDYTDAAWEKLEILHDRLHNLPDSR